MLFSKALDLEDRMVELVLKDRATIKSLHARLSEHEPLSLRAVYKAADKLIGAGVLLKAGKRVMVDEEWARRVGEKLSNSPLPAPAVGERILYTFSSIEHLDAFWKTIVLPIEESAAAREVFFFNPHNFWAYIPGREESEAAYYRHFSPNRHGFFTIGGSFEADMEFKREYQSEYLQIDTRDIGSLGRRDHITVIDSLIINVRLNKATTARIDELYASGRAIKDILPELLSICRAPGKIRFTLENNPAKAKKLRKILARNFYFPQH
jgi:hypothetical protein